MEGNLLAAVYPKTGFHLSIDLFLIVLGPAFLALAVVGYYLFRGARWAWIAAGIITPLALTLWIIGLVAADPIDRLVADLDSTHGMWVNGYIQFNGSRTTTSTEKAVDQFFKVALFDTGRTTGKVASYTIVKIRRVHLPTYSAQPPDLWVRILSLLHLERFAPSYGYVPTNLYMAVLALTDFGEKIIIFKPDEGWWGRAYDANRTYFAKVDMHETPLHAAVNTGSIDMVKRLLAIKLDVNARTINGWTPLFYAAMSNNKEIMELLLTNHAEVNIKDHSGETPLHIAAMFGHKDAAKVLLANGADINAKGSNRWTPLQTALHDQGGKEFVVWLLTQKPDVNARDYIGETALHLEAQYGTKDMVELLLNNQAEVNATNCYGWTPMHYAMARDNQGIIDLLRQRGGHE